MSRVRKVDCTADRPATDDIRGKISKDGEHPIVVVHDDVAYAEHGGNGPGFYCVACGDGPLGRVRSDNKYTGRKQ